MQIYSKSLGAQPRSTAPGGASGGSRTTLAIRPVPKISKNLAALQCVLGVRIGVEEDAAA
jgi:hypothetical protein